MRNSGNLVSRGDLVWKRLAALAALAALLTLCFIIPLRDWVGFSMDSEFYSYMPLMPLITGYLIWLRRAGLGADVRPGWGAAAAAAAGGGAVLALYFLALHNGWIPSQQDELCVMMLAFLLLLLAAGFATLGAATMSAIAFPLALLLFMVPYPEIVNDGLETFFQHTSAAAAHGFFSLAGTQCVRDGLVLSLPTDFSLRVAPECSGIHSSQVLLITSLLAGNLFLRSPWRRVFLALFVIPLAIARNGFRIFVVGELCVHVGHRMIDSPIHHRGGPIFFALSLIPFFLLLIWLRKSECQTQNPVKAPDRI
jgi:exosortase C (VPDSG-CTERM-specific)